MKKKEDKQQKPERELTLEEMVDEMSDSAEEFESDIEVDDE